VGGRFLCGNEGPNIRSFLSGGFVLQHLSDESESLGSMHSIHLVINKKKRYEALEESISFLNHSCVFCNSFLRNSSVHQYPHILNVFCLLLFIYKPGVVFNGHSVKSWEVFCLLLP
jgi:hypothetical protein